MIFIIGITGSHRAETSHFYAIFPINNKSFHIENLNFQPRFVYTYAIHPESISYTKDQKTIVFLDCNSNRNDLHVTYKYMDEMLFAYKWANNTSSNYVTPFTITWGSDYVNLKLIDEYIFLNAQFGFLVTSSW